MLARRIPKTLLASRPLTTTSLAFQASRSLPPLHSTLPSATRPLSTSTPKLAAASHDSHGHEDHGHESHYDPPGGWLWGRRPGEEYEREGWEFLMYYGFCGSVVVAIVCYAMKEDTSIQTWALEEARRRLEKEGILEDPFPNHRESDES